MEIVFQSPAQPERLLLHDALAKNGSETLSALLSAIYDLIFATNLLSVQSFSSSLEAIKVQESLFRVTLTNIEFNWKFTQKERYIIQDAASDGLYSEDDIERAFYKHGGYNGVIALILFFRKSENIRKNWATIIEGFRAVLVNYATKMLSSEIVKWIPEFLSTLGRVGPHPLQYLGGHAGRKRPRDIMETMDSLAVTQARCLSRSWDTSATVFQQFQESQEIHQIGQAVDSQRQDHLFLTFRLTTPKEDQQQQLLNTSLHLDEAGNIHQRQQQCFRSRQDVPTSILNAPSLKQNLPQQQQYRKPFNTSTDRDMESPPHQHIPTLISNVSSLCDNESLSFEAPSDDLIMASSIDHTNFPIDPLPLLLYALGGSQIRQDVLFRGLLPQKRWDGCGNVREITPRDAGFDEQTTSIFSSQTVLEQTIETCIRFGLVLQGVSEDGSLQYSITEQSRRQISQTVKGEELHLLGLIFTTHIYPRDQALEPSFQALGRLLLPYLERTWEFVLGERCPIIPAPIRDSLVEASLATYTLVGTSRKKNVISVLAKIQDPDLPDYLRMAIVYRKSILLRRQGDHDRSDGVIRDILESIELKSKDMRLYCTYGRLLLSLSENAILRKEFGQAESHLASWEVKNPEPSGLELQVVRLKNTVLGRVSRYVGKFSHARYCLEECLQTIPGDASRYHIMYHLGDVYCELGLPEEVETLVLDEIEQLRARGKQRLKAFRRLALPLAEAYIQQRKLEAAKGLLRELVDTFAGMVSHDVSDQLSHVRSMIGLARVNWYQTLWSKARQTLDEAMALTENYRTFSKGNYYKGVIYLFLSLVNFELHEYAESRLTLVSANDILSKEMPRHFIPGMGSYFLQYLVQVERSRQWPSSSINEIPPSAAFSRAQMI
ncbi:Uncharacterized protein BP5553_09751 [Venustampulla echinocandica]|uniref:Uncharacterized protein n=1 Tax=Venustampulla echinocandica TaxID=2656787 RepID=A0A370TBW3_9HELO|nr:Uncharacterized protein BP5553_09751 [Venustampulla echinocandica]RDL31542.1 Uncharacterized protein BP5553_09751 [Venustampulla echinocandica]